MRMDVDVMSSVVFGSLCLCVIYRNCGRFASGFSPPNLELKSLSSAPCFWAPVPPFLLFSLSRGEEVLLKVSIWFKSTLLTNPPFFTGCKLHPPGIGIEAPAFHPFGISLPGCFAHCLDISPSRCFASGRFAHYKIVHNGKNILYAVIIHSISLFGLTVCIRSNQYVVCGHVAGASFRWGGWMGVGPRDPQAFVIFDFFSEWVLYKQLTTTFWFPKRLRLTFTV